MSPVPLGGGAAGTGSNGEAPEDPFLNTPADARNGDVGPDGKPKHRNLLQKLFGGGSKKKEDPAPDQDPQ